MGFGRVLQLKGNLEIKIPVHARLVASMLHGTAAAKEFDPLVTNDPLA
jgi:hypothetical protein